MPDLRSRLIAINQYQLRPTCCTIARNEIGSIAWTRIGCTPRCIYHDASRIVGPGIILHDFPRLSPYEITEVSSSVDHSKDSGCIVSQKGSSGHGVGASRPGKGPYGRERLLLDQGSQPALFMTVRCVRPIATEAQWVPRQSRRVSPIAPRGAMGTRRVAARGGRRTGDPLLCRVQRVISTLTD